MNSASISCEKYINALHDLEAGLYRESCIHSHDIRRLEDKTLQISLRLNDTSISPHVESLVDRAKQLAWLAVHVNRFCKSRVEVKSINDKKLQEIVVE